MMRKKEKLLIDNYSKLKSTNIQNMSDKYCFAYLNVSFTNNKKNCQQIILEIYIKESYLLHIHILNILCAFI